ncbi:MAG: Maf family protein [Burkholderiaceae bacterium]|jgi:septum formation protein
MHRMLILASTSPYRRELLSRLGLAFECHPPGVEEIATPGEAPLALAQRLAHEKALAILARFPDATVIGSDQVALCKGRVLGKPGSAQRALEQLQWQRGSVTEFHTAFAVLKGDRVIEEVVTTRVQWKPETELTDARLQRYVAIERPLDCAGAAKSEGLGIALLESVESPDPTALIGLPMIRVSSALTALGWELLPRLSEA